VNNLQCEDLLQQFHVNRSRSCGHGITWGDILRITGTGGDHFFVNCINNDKLSFRVRKDLAWSIIPHIVEEYYVNYENRKETFEKIFDKEMK
jgi:hypothetical protein